jgi:hypothetical protein
MEGVVDTTNVVIDEVKDTGVWEDGDREEAYDEEEVMEQLHGGVVSYTTTGEKPNQMFLTMDGGGDQACRYVLKFSRKDEYGLFRQNKGEVEVPLRGKKLALWYDVDSPYYGGSYKYVKVVASDYVFANDEVCITYPNYDEDEGEEDENMYVRMRFRQTCEVFVKVPLSIQTTVDLDTADLWWDHTDTRAEGATLGYLSGADGTRREMFIPKEDIAVGNWTTCEEMVDERKKGWHSDSDLGVLRRNPE